MSFGADESRAVCTAESSPDWPPQAIHLDSSPVMLSSESCVSVTDAVSCLGLVIGLQSRRMAEPFGEPALHEHGASLGFRQRSLCNDEHMAASETAEGDGPLNPRLPWPTFERSWDVAGKRMPDRCKEELPPTQFGSHHLRHYC